MYSDLSHGRGVLYPCPRCNQTALYQSKPDLFRCIRCGFRKNLADEQNGLPLLGIAITVFIFLVLFL